ncbi:MAG: transglutaminase-like cysteine peptidase [Alphaproteobacteria bacterium]|nr:transglutaminase-like cysteine peptidase [Alphaproteobacteria bacterium]
MSPRCSSRLVGPAFLAILLAACASDPQPDAPLMQAVQPTPAVQQTIFPPQEIYSSNLSYFTRWTGVESRLAAQEQPGACIAEADGHCAEAQWAAFIDDLKSRPLADRVEHANEYLNAVRYVPATTNWGSPGYWETPFEFLARGGQCQDYAISKYLALEAAGVPDQDLRVAVVHDLQSNEDHAILIVTINGQDFVLDNLTESVDPLTSVTRYRAYYAINDTGWWAYFDPARRFATTQVAAAQ